MGGGAYNNRAYVGVVCTFSYKVLLLLYRGNIYQTIRAMMGVNRTVHEWRRKKK